MSERDVGWGVVIITVAAMIVSHSAVPALALLALALI